MPEGWNFTSAVVQFFIRAIVGMTLIFFINQFLGGYEVALKVGMNPVTFATSGIFGTPGVALLYGIAFYRGI